MANECEFTFAKLRLVNIAVGDTFCDNRFQKKDAGEDERGRVLCKAENARGST